MARSREVTKISMRSSGRVKSQESLEDTTTRTPAVGKNSGGPLKAVHVPTLKCILFIFSEGGLGSGYLQSIVEILLKELS